MTMVEIPSELLEAAGLAPEDVKSELALELFRQGRITASQFRSMAGDELHFEEAFLKKDQIERIDPSVRLFHKWVHLSSSFIMLMVVLLTHLLYFNFYAKITISQLIVNKQVAVFIF